MQKLIVFENLSLDGYFSDASGGLEWAHEQADDPEFKAFTADNAKGGGMLLFGRVTYELMKSYWPTPAAAKNAPDVARGMNEMPKVVFSRTLDEAAWQNTTVVKGDIAADVRRLKKESPTGIAIMGSGTIVSQLSRERLIDEYHFVVNPVVLGEGKRLFRDIDEALKLELTRTRAFRNGNVFLCYAPAPARERARKSA